MDNDENWLLSLRVRDLAARLAARSDATEDARLWREAQDAAERAGEGDNADVVLPLLERSLPALRALLASWDTGRAGLPAWDQAVLKRAMNAFRRRLKLTRTDAESSSSRNPLSRGESSGITGVHPPEQYPPEIWAVLVAQGRLRRADDGTLELASCA